LVAFYRSQHDNQSWLKSITAIMDACALIEMGFADDQPWMKEVRFQARATFAMSRHVMVDLAYILDTPPTEGPLVRMTPGEIAHIRAALARRGALLKDGEDADRHLTEIRQMYEPYAMGLAAELIVDLPKWCLPTEQIDNWQTSAWEGTKHF
jgi:hypothetical protein